MSHPLPKFENPPLVEVVLSVQFDRLNVPTLQLGLVWQRFRDRFKHVEEKPEIDAAFERFMSPERSLPSVRFEVGATPTPRFWFMNDDGNELAQVQRDRFIRNWRKTDRQPDYPTYDNLRAAFVNDWNIFAEFVKEELNAPLIPNQCEVTYVNIIDRIKPNRLDQVLSCISGSYSDDYLGNPEEAEVQFRYVLNDPTEKAWGRLHIVAAPSVRAIDNQRILRMSLTARGNPPSHDIGGAMTALDAGHEAVVRAFASITTSEMHSAWGRRS